MSTQPLSADIAREHAEERRLIERAQQGDPVAFRALYDRTLQRTLGQITRIVGPRGDVEDIAQKVYIQVHRSLLNFRLESRFSTWLYRITWNVTVSHIRGRKVPVDFVGLQPVEIPVDERGQIEARDRVRVLYAALDQVSVDAREAFIRCDVEGCTLQEIADDTGESINTIAARVRRTRDKLRTYLEAREQRPSLAAGGGR